MSYPDRTDSETVYRYVTEALADYPGAFFIAAHARLMGEAMPPLASAEAFTLYRWFEDVAAELPANFSLSYCLCCALRGTAFKHVYLKHG